MRGTILAIGLVTTLPIGAQVIVGEPGGMRRCDDPVVAEHTARRLTPRAHLQVWQARAGWARKDARLTERVCDTIVATMDFTSPSRAGPPTKTNMTVRIALADRTRRSVCRRGFLGRAGGGWTGLWIGFIGGMIAPAEIWSAVPVSQCHRDASRRGR